jgi:hypothetical protein
MYKRMGSFLSVPVVTERSRHVPREIRDVMCRPYLFERLSGRLGNACSVAAGVGNPDCLCTPPSISKPSQDQETCLAFQDVFEQAVNVAASKPD